MARLPRTLTRALRPRGVRPVLPAAIHSTLLNGQNQYGPAGLPIVNQNQALGLPAFYRGVNIIANGVASMAPLRFVAADGYTELPTPNVVARPNAGYTVFDFWHMAISTAIMRGNFLGINADYTADEGYPNQTVPIHPDFAFAYIDGAGYTVYSVAGMPLLSAEQVTHVRAFSTPGAPWGIGVVENFRRALGQQLDQQNLVASTYQTGAIPSLVLNLDRPEVSTEQANAVWEQWQAAHGAGQHRPAILPKTMSVQPLSLTPEATQFIQARQMSVAEMAFMLNLDPSDLGATVGGQGQQYANIEQRQQQRVIDAYGPLMLRFEQAWSDLTPGGNMAQFVPERLMRTDAKTRAEVDTLNINSGVTLLDEAREAAGKRPLTAAEKAELNAAPPLAVAVNAASKADGTDPVVT